MRIFVVGPQFADSFAHNVVATLQAMDHTVVSEAGTRARHHGNRYLNAFWRELYLAAPVLESSYFNRLVHQVKEFQPEFVLVTHSMLPPAVVRKVKQSCAAKVVCWFIDAITGILRQYLLGSPYDVVFFKEPFLVRTFRDKIGRDAHYLPECCNPMWHKRMPLAEADKAKYACDLASIGSLHYYRALMLERLSDCDLKIWGRNAPLWIESTVRVRYINHYVVCEEKAKAFSAAKILLNTISYEEIEGVNCTLFEAAGCGAFQIAEWKPALPELFEPEREIVTYRTHRELKEKVDYYLAHPEERAEISARSYARAHREHTYELRLRKMLGILGFCPELAESPGTALAARAVGQPIA